MHLHLEHPVVRRLLSRFVSQGFVHHDLSRACLSQTNDAIPRVILLGRLALYGPGAARLHEEIIPVTARWHESNRTEPLTPYARTAETETLRLLDDALIAPRDHRLNETIRRQLLESVTRDIQDLLPHLETRARERAHTGIVQEKDPTLDARRKEVGHRHVAPVAGKVRQKQSAAVMKVGQARNTTPKGQHTAARLCSHFIDCVGYPVKDRLGALVSLGRDSSFGEHISGAGR